MSCNQGTDAENLLIDRALEFLGEGFGAVNTLTYEGEDITGSMLVPGDPDDVKAKLVGKALHVVAIKEIHKDMYGIFEGKDCNEKDAYDELMVEFDSVTEPLFTLGRYYYKNGVDRDILFKMRPLAGKDSKSHVDNIVDHSLAIEKGISTCSEIYNNLSEWMSYFESYPIDGFTKDKLTSDRANR